MTHTYNLTGMTCAKCESKVKSAFLTLPDVTSVEVSKVNDSATITMEKHISLNALQLALSKAGEKYKITATQHNEVASPLSFGEGLGGEVSWYTTYKPILIIFFYITLISSVVVYTYQLNFHDWMNLFMAQFFLVFSFFKFLNLKAFAESYSMYDIVAMKIKFYGFVYPFIEMALGFAYLIQFNSIITNTTTIIVMGVSSIGVIISVIKKQRIQCACLGAVFNLPMSTVTIIEDLLMVTMAAIALIT